MVPDTNDIKIPVKWLLERVRQNGDVKQMEIVRRMVSDYVMSQLSADLLAKMDEVEEVCRKSDGSQLISISHPNGDVILTGGKKEENNYQ